MKAYLDEVVELCDSAAERTRARYGRVVSDDGDSVYIRTRPSELAWFVRNEEIKSVYVAIKSRPVRAALSKSEHRSPADREGE